jgi:hypothetical protein
MLSELSDETFNSFVLFIEILLFLGQHLPLLTK